MSLFPLLAATLLVPACRDGAPALPKQLPTDFRLCFKEASGGAAFSWREVCLGRDGSVVETSPPRRTSRRQVPEEKVRGVYELVAASDARELLRTGDDATEVPGGGGCGDATMGKSLEVRAAGRTYSARYTWSRNEEEFVLGDESLRDALDRTILMISSQLLDVHPGVKRACAAKAARIRETATQANHCRTAADCRTQPIGSCPLGCYALLNTSFDAEPLLALVKDYAASCIGCEYDCTKPSSQARLACNRHGRCVVQRAGPPAGW